MKKIIATLTVCALSATTANAAPTLYGKAFLSIDYLDLEKTTKSGLTQTSIDSHKVTLNSNGSRIGFKGSEAITNDTDIIYKLEYGINIDDSSKKQFYSRDTYLGLKNDQYGTLMVGRLKSIDKHIDFADVLVGKNHGKAKPTYSKPRLNNAFSYMSPDYKGAKLMAMYSFDSDSDQGSFDNENLYGLGISYANSPVKLGATYINHGDDQHIRLAGGYDFSKALNIGGYYQVSEFGIAAAGEKESPFSPVGNKKEHSIVVGAHYSTPTPWTYYGQLALINNVKGVEDDKKIGIGGGAKYAFTKAATGHIYAGYSNKREHTNSNKKDTKGFGIGTGLEYKF